MSEANGLLQQAFVKARAGNRNETSLWLACQLRDKGLSESKAEPIMIEYANEVTGKANEPYTNILYS
jgi:putative DNA primase/helicase